MKDSMTTKKFLSYVGPGKTPLVLGLFLGLMDTLLNSIGIAWGLKMISDGAVAHDLVTVSRAALLILAVVAFRGVFLSSSIYAVTIASEKMARHLRRQVMKSALGARAEYFDSHESGGVISRLINDVEVAKQGLRVFDSGVKEILMIASSLSALLIWNWKVALSMLCLAVFAFGTGALLAKPLKMASQKYQEVLGRLSESGTNLFSGVAVIKSLQAEREMKRRFGLVAYEQYRAGKKRGVLMALQVGAVNFVPWIGIAGLIIVAGYLAIRQELTPGDSIGLVQLAIRALYPFSALGGIWASFQQNLAAAARVEEALSIPAERDLEDGNPEEIGSLPQPSSDVPAVQFQDVTFSYRDKPVFQGLNLRLLEGQKAALIGPSGSGKSTIIKLLLGMYSPLSGRVLVRGRDVSDLHLDSLRQSIAVVPQEPWLMPGTIKDNIALGKSDVTDDEIVAAAVAANAHEFIVGLPEGYDTVVGERGGDLSGGQRQRICLARAFLKDAPVLLLDEPTSAVDAESERLIKEALDVLSQGRTVVTVAHTKGLVSGADPVISLGGSGED